MNIFIPHHWLLEHLETNATSEEIQRLLSLSGPSVERVETKEGESVYDIEVTTNRVDSLSVRGIAREAAVILQQAGIGAQLRAQNIPEIPAPQESTLPLPQIENDPRLCRRITFVILDHIKHTPTPEWMAKRLRQIDQNIHDSAIDITNYITHELGHPCHAFDYDKIMQLGGLIKVVEAPAGKKLTTLDGVEYATVGGEVVFVNADGDIIDLPAIKGTANTAVDDSTSRIMLWIESIVAEKVRFGSMTHAIRTVAAQLNEKHVDPNLAPAVLQRGVQLYQELCDASIASEVYDDFPSPISPAPISLSTKQVEQYLGISLDQDTITKILQALECQVEWTDDSTFRVTPPTFRPDLTIPADIIEELARIYGYHNIPAKIMDTPLPLNRPADSTFQLELHIKEWLTMLGWQELYTYSMVSETQALASGFTVDEHLRLQNPLTDDKVYLRRNLIPSLSEVLDNNSQRPGLSVFEIAYVYHPDSGALPKQELQLCLVGQKPLREMMGDVEVVLRRLFLKSRIHQESDTLGTLLVSTDGTDWTKCGVLSRLSNTRSALTIELTQLLSQARRHPNYKPLPKQPALSESLTFTVPKKTMVGPLIASIQAADPLIDSVHFEGSYQDNVTFAISYLHPDQPLSSKDIEPIRKNIVTLVESEYGGILVGTLS